MKRIQYNKLIRDNIPENIEKYGVTCITHIADSSEYKEKLYAKLLEEVNEFLEDDNSEELADVLEVIHAISDLKKIRFEEIEKTRLEKKEKKGGFKDKIILTETIEVSYS